jgi:hypothetical protein
MKLIKHVFSSDSDDDYTNLLINNKSNVNPKKKNNKCDEQIIEKNNSYDSYDSNDSNNSNNSNNKIKKKQIIKKKSNNVINKNIKNNKRNNNSDSDSDDSNKSNKSNSNSNKKTNIVIHTKKYVDPIQMKRHILNELEFENDLKMDSDIKENKHVAKNTDRENIKLKMKQLLEKNKK